MAKSKSKKESAKNESAQKYYARIQQKFNGKRESLDESTTNISKQARKSKSKRAEKLELRAEKLELRAITLVSIELAKKRVRKRFAGVWFYDTGPITVKKHDQLLHPLDGVVAVSGTVPLVTSKNDRSEFKVGDQIFVGVEDDRVYTPLPLDAEKHPSVAVAIAGFSAHQQLAVVPASLAPPDTSDDGCWGVPQFAPVIIGNDDLDLDYRCVTGAAHGRVPDENMYDGVDTGFRVLSVCGEAELRSYLVDAEDDKGNKLFKKPEEIETEMELRFIGTLCEEATTGTSLMVDLGGFLVHK